MGIAVDGVAAAKLLDNHRALGVFGAYLTRRFGEAGALQLLLGSLVAWTVVPLVLARWVIGRRDV